MVLLPFMPDPVPIDGEPVVLPLFMVPLLFIEPLPDEVLPEVVPDVVPDDVLPLPVVPLELPAALSLPVVPVPVDVLPEVVPVPVDGVPEVVPLGVAFVPGVVTPAGALRLVGSLGLLLPAPAAPVPVPPPWPLEPLEPLVCATTKPLAMARQAAATIVARWNVLLICLISWWKGERESARVFTDKAVHPVRQGRCPCRRHALPMPASRLPQARHGT